MAQGRSQCVVMQVKHAKLLFVKVASKMKFSQRQLKGYFPDCSKRHFINYTFKQENCLNSMSRNSFNHKIDQSIIDNYPCSLIKFEVLQ